MVEVRWRCGGGAVVNFHPTWPLRGQKYLYSSVLRYSPRSVDLCIITTTNHTTLHVFSLMSICTVECFNALYLPDHLLLTQHLDTIQCSQLRLKRFSRI